LKANRLKEITELLRLYARAQQIILTTNGTHQELIKG
jgi:hypothetical protein